ncbi:MAG: leucine-rich repeat domain-containing protein [Fluviicola sp.]|nr:leucine-rich repeat domain-containing protein [Fluviicola sp.]
MKEIFVLIFLLNFSQSFGQKYVVPNVIIYDWEEVKTANPDTIYGVSFQKMKLTEVPKELEKFKNLRVLDLSKNKITQLPKFIGELKFLEDLDLTKNKLKNYPIVLCKNSSLRFLRLGRNLFESIPSCIESLQNLEYLDLYDTPATLLPESLTRMEKLKEIDLSGIRFSPTFQETWLNKLPNVKLVFDAPCDCLE